MKPEITLTFNQVFPSGAYLAEVRPWMEYKNREKTGVQLGLTYIFVNRKGYDKVAVHVPSLTPVITQEEIQSSKEDIKVTAEDFRGRMYSANNTLNISAEAKEVKIIRG